MNVYREPASEMTPAPPDDRRRLSRWDIVLAALVALPFVAGTVAILVVAWQAHVLPWVFGHLALTALIINLYRRYQAYRAVHRPTFAQQTLARETEAFLKKEEEKKTQEIRWILLRDPQDEVPANDVFRKPEAW